MITPYCKSHDNSELVDWQEDLKTVHRSARAEHALTRMKNWTILRGCRRAAHTLRDTAPGSHDSTTSLPDRRHLEPLTAKVGYVTPVLAGKEPVLPDRSTARRIQDHPFG
ncbi:hypothetical protein [Saccharothrix sp. Mg75]|uniref:hypothetical protein n=1 Tax=Saccharothrix sp. Mg75 TaxID=3445357 RepID=UPI003EE9D0C9